MKKINIGIYGSEGRMGKDIISRARKFKEIEIAFLCEHSGHKSIGEKKDSLVIIHRNKKVEESLNNKLKIIDIRYYGLSKIIFANH